MLRPRAGFAGSGSLSGLLSTPVTGFGCYWFKPPFLFCWGLVVPKVLGAWWWPGLVVEKEMLGPADGGRLVVFHLFWWVVGFGGLLVNCIVVVLCLYFV